MKFVLKKYRIFWKFPIQELGKIFLNQKFRDLDLPRFIAMIINQ